MRSENLVTIISSRNQADTSLASLVLNLARNHFRVIVHQNIETALEEAPAFPEGPLLCISGSVHEFDLPPETQKKLGSSFTNTIFYIDDLPFQEQKENDQLSYFKRDTKDKEHKQLIKYLESSPVPQRAFSNAAHDILSAIADAVVSVNKDFRIGYMNSTACKLIGTSLETGIGQKVDELLDLRDPKSNKKVTRQVFEQYQRVLPDSESSQKQSQYLLLNSLNNQQYKIAIRNNTYYDSQNGIESVAVMRDITNKPGISHHFPISNNKYWALVNTTQLAYLIIDKQGKIRDTSEEFLRVAGLSKLQDIIGTSATKWAANYEKENVANAIEQLNKTGIIIGMEVDFKAIDGKITPIEFNATVFKENGDYHLLGIGRDITDRRQAEHEKELIQTQLRLAQKMESIGQLTGGIAHDFNNVLASILGYTELSQHAVNQAHQKSYHYQEETNKKLETYLGAIHEAGTRARDLIRQLMVFSRSSEISPQYIKIEPSINEIIKLLSSSLPQTINVTTHFEKNLPFINIDPSQLYEIIMYLFYNSKDALHDEGEISITVSYRHRLHDKTCSSCHSKINNDYIDITVKDNGPGIAKQHLDRVFEPFYTTKTIGQGTGMGLPMVHGIVHEHGGHILLESGLQKGTTTHLLFPVSNTTENAPEKDSTSHLSSGTKGHIVVVEDEESLANFLNDLFSNNGYKVTVYTNSLQAREQLPGMLDDIDLILTDHAMPGITGIELAKVLLAIKPDLPIILCTGFSFQISEKTAYAIGIRRFLKKPISSSELLKEAEELVRNPAPLSTP